MTVYKYGVLSDNQIENEKQYLQKSIYKLLCFKEEKYEFLDQRFVSIMQHLDGLSRLLPNESIILSIMCLLEHAKSEDDFTLYRKAILDATSLVENIKVGDLNV